MSTGAFAQPKNNKLNIEAYFNLLPDTCFYLCNWRGEIAKSVFKTIDNKKGFLAIKRMKNEHDFFQMALFKGKKKEDYIAVSTRECESPACFRPSSFFYQYKMGKWLKADSILFAGIKLELFYSDSSDYNLLKTYGYYKYNYILPQQGTTIRIELELCDYRTTDHPEVTEQQYEKLVRNNKSVYLAWDSNRNNFQVTGK
jgi:hypothetical protein